MGDILILKLKIELTKLSVHGRVSFFAEGEWATARAALLFVFVVFDSKSGILWFYSGQWLIDCLLDLTFLAKASPKLY